jgi:hypothetical protein
VGTEYRLDVHTPAGVALATLTGGGTGGFRTLLYNKVVNGVGLLTFTLDGTDSLIASLADKAIIEVWRRNIDTGITWYRDWMGLYRKQRRRYTDHGMFVATCQSPLVLLSWRIVAYKAATGNRSVFIATPAETIMKTMAEYNAGASATVANGRERTANTLGITCEADGGGGNVLEWRCAWDNLLASLQSLALVGGGDFDLVSTGAAAWEFRWYTGQLGTDRSGTVTFALEFGNMANPEYIRDRTNEATVCIVAADGEEAARNVTVRTGADYAADNDIEVLHSDGNLKTLPAREAAGDSVLRERQAEHTFTFDVIQDGAKLYGRDYFVGDLVTARFDTVEVTRKIAGVTVEWQEDGAEVVTPELAQV